MSNSAAVSFSKCYLSSLSFSLNLLQIVMLRNEVCECRASGVFLRLSAQGLIAENNIHSNGEAGLDIRKGANPIIVVIAAPLSIMSRKKQTIPTFDKIILTHSPLFMLSQSFQQYLTVSCHGKDYFVKPLYQTWFYRLRLD